MTPIAFYSEAKSRVIDLGFGSEIEWQAAQHPQCIGESEFLREAAWVVYCCGFREATVRRYFNYLSLCFCDWLSATEIAANQHQCVLAAMRALANRRKHEAVVAIARRIADDSFEAFRREMFVDPAKVLQQLPFLGPVTAVHLAKNLGFDIAKPDRHLVRLKDRLGFKDVGEMCSRIADASGDSVRVVDLVLWRYLERSGVANARAR